MNYERNFCNRVSSSDWSNLESRLYSEKSVRDLIESEKFKKFYRHKQWIAALHYLWIFAGLMISFVMFYCWLFVDQNIFIEQMSGSDQVSKYIFFFCRKKSLMSSSLPFVDVVLYGCIFYLLPAFLLLSFTGNRDEVSPIPSTILYFYWVLFYFVFACYNRKVENGAKELISIFNVLSLALWDSISLQGYFVSSLIAAKVIFLRWERAWLISFPALTFPAIIGICGVGFRYLLHRVLLFFLSSELSDNYTLSQDMQRLVNVSSRASSWKSRVLLSYNGAVECPEKLISMKQFLHFPAFDFHKVFPNPQIFYCTFLMTIFCFLISLCASMASKAAIYIMFFFPSHPSTWGIFVLGTLASVITCCYLCPDAFFVSGCLLLVLFSLLYNGFVA